MTYKRGDWLATCYQCGRKQLASELKRHWQGYWVCYEHWEERHPQEFVRNVVDNTTVPFVQAQWEQDINIAVCTINGRAAVAGWAIPGCMFPGNSTVNPEMEGPDPPPLCDVYAIQGVPGWGGPGCAVPGFDPMVS